MQDADIPNQAIGSRTIWMAWLQGRAQAPRSVQGIFDLWEALHPDATVRVLDKTDTDKILADLSIHQPRVTPQVTTDVVRTYLLATQGGVWADATLLPTQPLETWLDASLSSQGFFAFRSTGDPNLVLQNWFLYSEANHPLTTAWLNSWVDYLRTPRLYPTWKRALWHSALGDYLAYLRHMRALDTLWFVDPQGGRGCRFYPYAVHNYTLSHVLKTQPDIRDLWNAVPVRWQVQPSAIGAIAGDRDTPPQAFLAAATELLSHAPVHKLNHQDTRFEELVNLVKEMHGVPR